MLENKNIEKLFQDNLQDFEVQPSPKVWDKIESELTKKKRKRIVPIWWISSGIASLIVIGILINTDFEKNTKPFIEIDSNRINNSKETQTDISEIDRINVTDTLQVEKSIKNSRKRNIPPKSFELVASSSESIKPRKYVTSNVFLKDLQVDGKIAMENLFIEKIEFKKKERELEKRNFIAEVTNKETSENTRTESSKWSISPVLGVLSSQSFTEASAIDSNFNENKISSPQTFSYGLSLAYQLTNKLSIKSGVQIQNMSFTTENVSFVDNSFVTNNLSNINFDNQANLLYVNAEDFSALNFLNLANLDITEGILSQVVNYIEVPMELKYQVLDKKLIRTNIVSGISTLFLNEHSIRAESAIFSGTIGEANNLNRINFSANLGFDVEFNLSKTLLLNINPMFKAQLNTFSEDSTNFKPYIIGIYSGLRYKF
jgi:hypothetical protein